MATERLSMRKAREVLRQKWVLGKTHREVAGSVDLGVGTITKVLRMAERAGLSWDAVTGLSDAELEERMFGPRPAVQEERNLPEGSYILAELSRTGVTRQLLHEEYLERNPDGYGYTVFCGRYREWVLKRKLPMRQEHRAGEKMFADYSGKKPRIVDAGTGEEIEVELFVAALGASSYTYAEATGTQRTEDWIGSNTRALAFFGGVPRALVPDQLKAAVSSPSRYEPEIARTYEDFARHYGTVVLPARPRRPRDKAKVEVAVQVCQRWVVARLRNERFFSLEALNVRIGELLVELNERKMRHYEASRRELFERLDRPALLPLPSTAYEICHWKKARVNIDYHVELDHHFYSAPHALVHEEVELRFTAATVEVLHGGVRVASHTRSYRRGGYTTLPEHMPKAHQKHLQWSPSRILAWAGSVGPKTQALAAAILAERQHPEQGYRSCLGILRLAKQYGTERIEAACGRAHAAGVRSCRNVESILRRGLDRVPLPPPESTESQLLPAHENVRGSTYYH